MNSVEEILLPWENLIIDFVSILELLAEKSKLEKIFD